MFRIQLNELPPSEFSPNSRVHWSVKRRVRMRITDDILALAHTLDKTGMPFTRAVVRFKVGIPDKRVRDMDNLIASCIPLLNAIKRIIIKDDNLRSIKLEYSWFESPREPKTVIEVDPLPSPLKRRPRQGAH